MIVRFERGTFSSGFFPRGYFSAAARTHLAAGIRVDLERRARVSHGLMVELTGQQLTTERFPHTPAAPDQPPATCVVAVTTCVVAVEGREAPLGAEAPLRPPRKPWPPAPCRPRRGLAALIPRPSRRL